MFRVSPNPFILDNKKTNRKLLRLKKNRYFLILGLLFIISCDKPSANSNGTVHVSNKGGRYTIIKDGKPFLLKGASGYTFLKELKNAGGNTIRTWDTAHLDKILIEAKANNLSVIVGLSLPGSEDGGYLYEHKNKVNSMVKSYAALVEKYKDHKSLLFWCVGNELEFPYFFKSGNFYSSYNRLVDTIHKVDPNHPVTTTMVNVNRKSVINLKLRTNIDFISINTFGGLLFLKDQLNELNFFWNGPYLITEWGVDGPWGLSTHSKWRSYLELSSTEKATRYYSLYKNYMPVDDPRFIGAMVFYWGNKQEYTPTWYSLFAENGSASETVATMKYLWTGKLPKYIAPQIASIRINNKEGKDNIILKSNITSYARVMIKNKDTTGLVYTWQVLPEDWYQVKDVYASKRLIPLRGLVAIQHRNNVTFKTPTKEGPYRIYVNIYDNHNNVSTANVPFYVINSN